MKRVTRLAALAVVVAIVTACSNDRATGPMELMDPDDTVDECRLGPRHFEECTYLKRRGG
jgi:hypothetical protein